MPQLFVSMGDGQERTVELTDRPVSFGRSDDNDVVLTEAKASRRHCTFRPVAGGWRVVDEQSSNGTWVGGKPILSARLQPSDEIEIGDTVITFVAQPSEMPKPELIRARRVRKIRMPWEGLVAACALAVVAWFGCGALRDAQTAREGAAWKRVALARIDEAALTRDDAAFRKSVGDLRAQLAQRTFAEDAVRILDGALQRGLPAAPAPAQAAWRQTLDQVDAARARMTAAERRNRLRDLLSRNVTDAAAAEAIAAVLRTDAQSAAERARTEAERLAADAEKAAADGRYGLAIDDWAAWLATAPGVRREDEAAVAKRIADVRATARDDAAVALAQYEEHLKEGRLAAANSVVDATSERIRGTGWDTWLRARTNRVGRPAGSPGGGVTPVAGGPTESESARAKRVAKEALDRAMRAADALASRRKFADAAVALNEAAAAVTDGALQSDLRARAEDLSATADVLAKLLTQIREDPARFAVAVPVAGGGTGKVTGADDAGLLIGDAKGASPASVPVESVAPGAFAALLEKAKLEPASYVGAALLLHEVGEETGYTAWMFRAVSDASDDARLAASAVHARVKGETLPDGGYVPHPKDGVTILSWEARKRLENSAKIAEQTAQLAKLVEKIEASKQAKQVEVVAQAYAKLQAARKHALELIFDEVRYFYPYRTRMKEYVPVQRDVDERVAKVEEAWNDPASAKVRPDAALEKLIKQADDLGVEIAFLGGEPQDLIDRVDRLRQYLGRELTVQTFFETKADADLIDYNRSMMDANAKAKGDIDPTEREQVRITNEYRRMFGHRRVLRMHEKLILSSRGHSDDMARLGFFDHFSPVDGKKTPMDRMLLAGYPNTPCSENIHAGSGDPQGAHNGWVHSSGHHRNILMPGWSEMGTGRSGKFWTQNFGFASGDEQVGGAGPQ